jgi:long-subunit acyl-CoA synthetase (AMP-forming)
MEKVVESLFVAGGSWQKVIDCNEPRRDVRSNPGDLAVLPYSSGTTGNPKGVMLTHSNILANIRQLQALGWVQQDDIVVNIFPLYHVAGLNSAMNTFLAAGATIVLMRRFDLQVS